MTQPCNGCKALVIQTQDDYNLYSLQRALYPVDPLLTIPEPTSWVTHTCPDGTVIKKLYTQNDDWDTFWQQEILAECANHTVAEDPIVETKPVTDITDDFVPDTPKTPNPANPVPDTTIPAPPVAPPTSTPTPSPTPGATWEVPYGGSPMTPVSPDDGAPTVPTDDDLPDLEDGESWALSSETFMCGAFNDAQDEDHADSTVTAAALVYLKNYAAAWLETQTITYPIYAWWGASSWQWLTGQPTVGTRNDAYGTYASNGGTIPLDGWVASPSQSQYHQLVCTLYFKQKVST